MYMDLEAVDTGTVSRELTVEECLVELRETFPKKTLWLERDDYFRLGASSRDDMRMPKVKLTVPEVERKHGPPLVIEAYTLSDCMAQVRQWRKKQQ